MSLRTRLVAATALVALIALAVAGVATYAVFARSQLRPIDDGLTRASASVEPLVQGSPTATQQVIEQTVPATFVELRRADGTVVFSVPARQQGDSAAFADLSGLAEFSTPARPAAATTARFATVPAVKGDGPLRVRVARLPDGSVLAVGQSVHEITESRSRLVDIQVGVAVGALVVAVLLGWALVHVGLRPLRKVERTALAIAGGGDLEHQVPGADRANEIGRLAAALNTMLERIRGAFSERDATEAALRGSEQRMRRFVADVSHELRTPLAAVSAYAELFGRGANQRPDDLERAMRGIETETARMRDLVEELLLLARLDEGRPLADDPVDLSEIAVQAARAAGAVGPGWPIALRLAEVVTVVGDAGRLRQVIDNLLANVRTHTPAGTQTTVEIDRVGGSAVLTVEDDGPGMTAEQSARIFERFYRADVSRSRASGGAGLGLAIVDAIVAAHGGRVDVETSPGNGMRVEIRLPVVAPDQQPKTNLEEQA